MLTALSLARAGNEILNDAVLEYNKKEDANSYPNTAVVSDT